MDMQAAVETPAEKAIRLLGLKRIAAALDLTTDAIYKWRNLRDGRIPAKHQPALLALARERGVPFTAEDIIGGAVQ